MALWTPLECLSLLQNGETSSSWKVSSFLVMWYGLAGWCDESWPGTQQVNSPFFTPSQQCWGQ